jgi:hypothetical protein
MNRRWFQIHLSTAIVMLIAALLGCCRSHPHSSNPRSDPEVVTYRTQVKVNPRKYDILSWALSSEVSAYIKKILASEPKTTPEVILDVPSGYFIINGEHYNWSESYLWQQLQPHGRKMWPDEFLKFLKENRPQSGAELEDAFVKYQARREARKP